MCRKQLNQVAYQVFVPMAGNTPSTNKSILYMLLALGVFLLGLAGYVGYVVYPRFDLPSVTGSGLLLLAAGAGIGSFFSPCSFPLLLTLLARQIGQGEQENRDNFGFALRFAAALSLGATIFLLITGTVIALGGGLLFPKVTFTSAAGVVIRLVTGFVLILFGLIQLEVIPVSFHGVANLAQPVLKYQAELRRGYPTLAFAVFGFGYLLAGFG